MIESQSSLVATTARLRHFRIIIFRALRQVDALIHDKPRDVVREDERILARPTRDQSLVVHEAEVSLPAFVCRARGREQAVEPTRLARRKQATELASRCEDGLWKLHRALGEAAQLLGGLW